MQWEQWLEKALGNTNDGGKSKNPRGVIGSVAPYDAGWHMALSVWKGILGTSSSNYIHNYFGGFYPPT
jgi:hypothetical protein